MPDKCIFCQLLENPEQTLTVHETDSFRAWLDINPRAKGHTMIVPKKHLTSAEDVGANLTEMFDVARICGEKAVNGLGADGYSIVVNNGEAAGQMMDHFYMIMFPRYSDEDNSGTPTGAIFRPKEDLDKKDLARFQADMDGAGFSEHSSSAAPSSMVESMKKSGEDEEKEERGKDIGYRKKGSAEFK